MRATMVFRRLRQQLLRDSGCADASGCSAARASADTAAAGAPARPASKLGNPTMAASLVPVQAQVRSACVTT